MSITLKLFAYFRDNRGEVLKIDYTEGMRPSDLCKKINLDLEEVSILLVNGVYTKEDPVLEDGDLVSMFPAVGGG